MPCCSSPPGVVAVSLTGCSTKTYSKELPKTLVARICQLTICAASQGTKNAPVTSLAENMARLGPRRSALRDVISIPKTGRDAVVAASLSANALAELAASVEQADAV